MIAPAVLDCALEVMERGDSLTAQDLGLSVSTEIVSAGVEACV